MKLSIVLNILLCVALAIVITVWRLEAKDLSHLNKLRKTRRDTAVIIAFIVEEALQGFQKKQLDELMLKIAEIHPDYKSSIDEVTPLSNGLQAYGWGHARKISQLESCFYYGGVYFLFKEDKFSQLDNDMRCSIAPLNGGIFNR